VDRDRARARELARQYLAKGDPTGWFEQLYREGERGQSAVPWEDLEPSPNLLDFWRRRPLPADGLTALTIGCGFGDDSEQLASWGFQTTAFDVAETAIRACRERFPASAVDYVVADLLHPPGEWAGRFDFIFECNTVQALPPSVRGEAIRRIAGFVAPGGRLLIIARARDESDPPGDMPWPLTHGELDEVLGCGLRELSFEDYPDRQTPPVRRFRALYGRD